MPPPGLDETRATHRSSIYRTNIEIRNEKSNPREFFYVRSLFLGEGNSKFKIQDSKLMAGMPGILGIFPIRAAACREHARSGPTPNRGEPAAERTGLRHEGAALRPGAAAGCRPLRDRFPIRTAACGGPHEADLRDASCGPPPPGGCGPHGPDGPILTLDLPAAKRTGTRLWRSSPPPGSGCGLPAAARPSHKRNRLKTKQLPAARRPQHRPAAGQCGASKNALILRALAGPTSAESSSMWAACTFETVRKCCSSVSIVLRPTPSIRSSSV